MHVRRQVGQHAITRLAFAQRAQIARIERRQAHQALEVLAGKVRLVQKFERAFGDRALAQRGFVVGRNDDERRVR